MNTQDLMNLFIFR